MHRGQMQPGAMSGCREGPCQCLHVNVGHVGKAKANSLQQSGGLVEAGAGPQTCGLGLGVMGEQARDATDVDNGSLRRDQTGEAVACANGADGRGGCGDKFGNRVYVFGNAKLLGCCFLRTGPVHPGTFACGRGG